MKRPGDTLRSLGWTITWLVAKESEIEFGSFEGEGWFVCLFSAANGEYFATDFPDVGVVPLFDVGCGREGLAEIVEIFIGHWVFRPGKKIVGRTSKAKYAECISHHSPTCKSISQPPQFFG